MAIRHNFTVAHSVLTNTSDHEHLSKLLTSVTIKGANYNVNSLLLIETDSLTSVFGFIVEIFSEGSIDTVGFIIKVLTLYACVHICIVMS